MSNVIIHRHYNGKEGQAWSWSYGSWIYNYLCSQCLSPLTLWVWIQLRRGVLDTTLCDEFFVLVTGRWFSSDTMVPPPIELTTTI